MTDAMRPVNPELIVERVAEWYYVTAVDVRSGCKKDRAVKARRGAVRILHDMAGFSWAESARYVGAKSGFGRGNGLVPMAQKLEAELAIALQGFVLLPAA